MLLLLSILKSDFPLTLSPVSHLKCLSVVLVKYSKKWWVKCLFCVSALDSYTFDFCRFLNVYFLPQEINWKLKINELEDYILYHCFSHNCFRRVTHYLYHTVFHMACKVTYLLISIEALTTNNCILMHYFFLRS